MERDDASKAFDIEVLKSLELTDGEGNPNLRPLAVRLRDIHNLSLTVKFFGYELARRLAEEIPVRSGTVARYVGLTSKPSTQADLQSDWASHWASELKVPVIFHRKLWEFVFLLQALDENNCIRADARGLGFGVGQEPIPSYLASKGVKVTVTDLPPEELAGRGWAETQQHTGSLDHIFKSHLVDRAVFDSNVTLQFVDMNNIPPTLTGYDFCWSICALEHIGSIEAGLNFVCNSIETLKPGGIAIHTTEFNFNDDEHTLDNWPTVLFQKKHFQQLAERLKPRGHVVFPLDFDVGSNPLDKFIDVPPFVQDWKGHMTQKWNYVPHLKLSVGGFACTCYGLIIRKGRS